MKLLFENWRQYLKEEQESTKWENLQAKDQVIVYHGTALFRLPDLINGFDANKTVKRDYQPSGYRHSGLFVSPEFDTARRFGSGVVLEIETMAKHLHGTDYSGHIRRKKGSEWDWEKERDKEKYPNSFRPGLSATALQATEPQALLRGLVNPRQIKRIWYGKPYQEQDKWYTRQEFLELGIEVKGKPIKDAGYDLSYPGYSLDEFFEATAASWQSKGNKVDAARVEQAIMREAGLPAGRREPALKEMMEDSGFGPTAVRAFLAKVLERAKAEEGVVDPDVYWRELD